MSANVHVFPVRARRHRDPVPDASAALAGVASRAAQIGLIPIETKQDMQQAIFLLDLYMVQTRQLIGCIGDDASRARLLAHSALIGELVEIARRKAAAL